MANKKLPPSKEMYVLAMARSRRILDGINSNLGGNMKNKYSEFHYHEVMDRTHVVLSSWEANINEHEVVQGNDELKEKSEEIIKLIGDFYQLIANVEEKNENK